MLNNVRAIKVVLNTPFAKQSTTVTIPFPISSSFLHCIASLKAPVGTIETLH
jgi:hypothetical protein